MEFRKLVSLFLVAAFLHLSFACTMTVKRTASALEQAPASYRVARIERTTGETLKLPKGTRGRLEGGELRLIRYVRIDPRKATIVTEGDRAVVTMRDGRTLTTTKPVFRGRRFLAVVEPIPPIPVPDIVLVWIKKHDPARTLFLVLGGAGVLLVAAVGIGLLISGGFPPIGL